MSNEKQLEDLVLYVQNLHDRLKIVENWILKQETKQGGLTDAEEQVIKETIKEAEELNS